MKKIGNSLILIVFLLVLWLPFVRQQWHIPGGPEGQLHGVGYTTAQPPLTLQGLRDATYQDAMDIYAKEHVGYRTLLVQLYQQLDYDLYDQLAAGILPGRDGYLFDPGYVRQYLGLDCLSDSQWSAAAAGLRTYQDTLALHHTTVLYCIAPGKASYAADKLPDAWLRQKKSVNNYQLMKAQLAAHGCRYIDFHQWFDTLRYTEREKLYPDVGTHWSVYGASLALDSLLRYMAHDRSIILRPYHKKLGPKVKPEKWLDTDLRDMTNLLFEIPAALVSYPQYSFDTADTTGYYKPKILVVADSYFSVMEFSTDLYQLFDRSSRVWDYNTRAFDFDGQECAVPIRPVDAEQFDYVIFLSTEKNYEKFDFGVAEAYRKAKH